MVLAAMSKNHTYFVHAAMLEAAIHHGQHLIAAQPARRHFKAVFLLKGCQQGGLGLPVEWLVEAVLRASPAPSTLAAPPREQVIDVPGFADFLAVDGDSVWVTNAGRVERWSRKGRLAQVAMSKPCGAMAILDGSLWVADCKENALVRIDTDKAVKTATIATGLASTGELNVVAGAGSVWVASDNVAGAIARVDPATNAVIATITVDPNDKVTPLERVPLLGGWRHGSVCASLRASGASTACLACRTRTASFRLVLTPELQKKRLHSGSTRIESGARAATVEARQAAVAPMASTTGRSGKSRLHFAAARYRSRHASSRGILPFRASLNRLGRMRSSCLKTAFNWLRSVAGFMGVLMKANKRDAVRLLNSATRNVRRQLRAAYVPTQS